MKAVILAGGYGKRLRPITDQIPKPMIEVGGKPIIEWQIMWLKSFGIRSFVVLAGHLKERLIEYLDDSAAKWHVEFEYSEEKEPLGSGGALKNAEKQITRGSDEFIATNGDVITNIDMSKIKLGTNIASIALVQLRSPYGIVNTEGGKIRKFEEKPLLKEYWINAGVYIMKNEIFKYLQHRGDMERTTFVELSSKNMLGGVKFPNSYWRSIDSIKDMEEVSADLKAKPIV